MDYHSIPRSVITVQFDVEEPSWEPLFRDCNLMYLRLIYGSINDDIWPNIYRKVSEYVKHIIQFSSPLTNVDTWPLERDMLNI